LRSKQSRKNNKTKIILKERRAAEQILTLDETPEGHLGKVRRGARKRSGAEITILRHLVTPGGEEREISSCLWGGGGGVRDSPKERSLGAAGGEKEIRHKDRAALIYVGKGGVQKAGKGKK